MAPYTKVYLSVAEQIERIKSRGMQVSDEAKAAEYLGRIGYYRLSAYWHPFRDLQHPLSQDHFRAGTQFNWVTDLYAFDKGVRLLMLDLIERVEIFARTAIALQLGKKGGWAHREPRNFDRSFGAVVKPSGKTTFDEWLERLDEKARTSKEEFAQHHRLKYPESPLPIWVAVELLDFGPLSIMFSGLRWDDQAAIAASIGVSDPKAFASWLRCLSVVRNVCAHHARLWNRPLVDQPKLYVDNGQLLAHLASTPYENRRVYAACAVGRFLLLGMNPRTKWPERFKDHMEKFPDIPVISIKLLGFPEGWDQLSLWK